MKYLSTRGHDRADNFSTAVLTGLAADGGLLVPQSYPHLSAADLAALRPLTYPELAFALMRLYISDIPAPILRALIDKTYTAAVFGNNDITPVHRLDGNLYLLALANGPTLAFKDLAMQFLGNLFEYLLERDKRVLNILGATSGDTGSAAEYALRGKKNITVFMLSPKNNMSAFQRAQMYTLKDANIHNLAVNGLFDDCQDIVKAIFADLDFKNTYNLGAVNSINWGRILAQIVYYFKAYFAVSTAPGEPVSFCVPSGNFGDVYAGHVARMMGLPIKNLLVATNENNVLSEFFTTGIYSPRPPALVKITSSPSMDIAKASNLERFIFDLVGRDPRKINTLWQELAETGHFNLTALLPQIQDQFGFYAGESTHQNRLDTIRTAYQQYGTLIDPHTADALYVAGQRKQKEPMIVLETALPVKFAATIEEALGFIPAAAAAKWQDLLKQPQRVTVLDNKIDLVKTFITQKALPSDQ